MRFRILAVVTSAIAVGVLATNACSRDKPTALSTPTTPTSVTSISVDGTMPNVGTSTQFNATATLSSGTTQTVTSQATWSSSDTLVATVSASGVVTGLRVGPADIIGTYQGLSGSRHILVVSCTYTLSILSVVDGSSDGGAYPVVVTTADGCTWSAGSGVSWIHVLAPAFGMGTGTVTFSVDANSGPSRIGTLTIAGWPVTFTQPQLQPSNTIYTLNVTLAQGLHLSGPYAAKLTGPNGFTCVMSQSQESVACPVASFSSGTFVPILVTITVPDFANDFPIWDTSGCDATTKNTCTVLMNANKTVTIKAGRT